MPSVVFTLLQPSFHSGCLSVLPTQPPFCVLLCTHHSCPARAGQCASRDISPVVLVASTRKRFAPHTLMNCAWTWPRRHKVTGKAAAAPDATKGEVCLCVPFVSSIEPVEGAHICLMRAFS